MSDWQDIKTAPRDGTRIQLLIPYEPSMYSELDCTDEGYWEPLSYDPVGLRFTPDWAIKDGGCFRFDGDDGSCDIQPTHWKPLSTDATKTLPPMTPDPRD